MATKLDEKFEATGYDQSGWSETAGAGNTVDEDADVADVGSPSGWGSKCLKIAVAGTNSNAITQNNSIAALPDTWVRVEFHWISYSQVGSFNRILLGMDAGFAKLYNLTIRDPTGGGDFDIELQIYHDGSSNSFFDTGLSLNTTYRYEFKWDSTNNVWEWRRDGNTLDSGTLTSTHPTEMSKFYVGIDAANNLDVHTVYWDLITIDDADWVVPDINMIGPQMMLGVGT